jgi:threonine dehydrogenase-like Zn-dependent dehydrogenase
MGRHQSAQQVPEAKTVIVPASLPPQKAVLARLMGVTMTTLMTTAARPGDRVMVTGAGPVGFLGAHLFARSGYEVVVVEPDERRHAPLVRSGLTVYPKVPVDDTAFAGTVALALECSGHEQAVLDACKVVRKKGEVVLVGVPWQRRTDLHAHDILHAVFHRYVVLRSGWEWELPHLSADLQPHSIFSGFALAMKWLNQGLIKAEGLTRLCDPRDPQPVYQDLLNRRGEELFCVFDWTRLAAGSDSKPRES